MLPFKKKFTQKWHYEIILYFTKNLQVHHNVSIPIIINECARKNLAKIE
jgi:hypothetical protein